MKKSIIKNMCEYCYSVLEQYITYTQWELFEIISYQRKLSIRVLPRL